MEEFTLEEALENELISEEALKFDNPDFDTAIIGITDDDRLIYDFDLMVKQYIKDTGCDYLEAIEFIEYNTLRTAHCSLQTTPIILMTRINNEI